MPNWTSNTLKAPVAVLSKYINKDEEGYDRFDFNLIIPRPKIYDDPDLVSGGHQDVAIYWYRSERGTKEPEKINMNHITGFSPIYERILYEKINGICSWGRGDAKTFGRNPYLFGKDPDEIYEIGRKYIEAYEKYGFLDWYDWSNVNWGTKWNACDTYFDPENEKVDFSTAWSYPKPIIEKIFADNPNCRIDFWWSDEDYDGDHWMIREEDGSLTEGVEYNESHYLDWSEDE